MSGLNARVLVIWNINSFIYAHCLRLLIPAPPPLALRGQDKESDIKSLLSDPFTTVVMTTPDGVHGTVCTAQQYLQSLQSQNSPSPSISCLTHGECIGLVVSI